MQYILLFEERELVEVFVDAVLWLKKHGGLEERKQVFSGCSTLREKQLRVSDQSLEWQSNQAAKSQTRRRLLLRAKIMRKLILVFHHHSLRLWPWHLALSL